ncbi:MAG: hypothetical protein K2J82_08535 [Muribaculaceae bacterium]|nr:hypothetical protein [Muribaculaceae bacterium]MDE6754643.1 hypothetical protein [Muribaculaceae bacterium]
MKILFLGDYSNLHACLANELKLRGHEVKVVSHRDTYMKTYSDIFLKREPGIIGGFSYLFKIFSLLPKLKDFDVVQLVNPNFLSLRPGKIKYFFDYLRDRNRSMFLTLAGNDYFFVRDCMKGDLFRFSEFKVGNKPTEFLISDPDHAYGWISNLNRDLNTYIYNNIDGAMSVLPEYDMVARPILGDRLAFTNIPVELSSLPYSPLEINGPLRLFIGLRGGMEIQKGTARLLEISKDLEREMPGKVKVETARNLSLKDYLERMKNTHFVLDQLFSYSPATNALQAMALGRVAGSGAEPEYYSYIGNPQERPVFRLSPLITDLKERLRSLILNPAPLYRMSREGRKLVERHNDVAVVADRFLNHWNSILASKG